MSLVYSVQSVLHCLQGYKKEQYEIHSRLISYILGSLQL